ncbi:MAG: alpha/beta hydrolase, partial [Sciscionella sp.]
MPRPPAGRATRLPKRPALAALLALLSVALLAGCTAGPSTRPAVVVRSGPGNQEATNPGAPNTPNLPPLEKPTSSDMPWVDCDQETRKRLGNGVAPKSIKFQCAQLLGAVEPRITPQTEITRISVLKAGNGPVPLVVLNDADGVPGSLYAANLAGKLPTQLLKTFSLIGVDRRGTGESDGVHCIPPDVRQALLGYDPHTSQLGGLIQAGSTATQQCVIALDNRLQTLNTTNTVDDLETLRQALHVDKLNALSRGEASRVLSIYAQRHSAHVGRFVLDGLPDPTVDDQARAEGKAMAAEDAFDAFAGACKAGDCPLGDNPEQTLRDLLGQLASAPLLSGDGIRMTSGMALNAVLVGLADRSRWTELATALSEARSGRADALANFVRPLLTDSLYESARLDAGLIIGCNDDKNRLPPERATAAYNQWKDKYPLFGTHFAQSLLSCL